MGGQQSADDDLAMIPQEVVETTIERSGLVDYYA
jgi:hypothetical protein